VQEYEQPGDTAAQNIRFIPVPEGLSAGRDKAGRTEKDARLRARAVINADP